MTDITGIRNSFKFPTLSPTCEREEPVIEVINFLPNLQPIGDGFVTPPPELEANPDYHNQALNGEHNS